MILFALAAAAWHWLLQSNGQTKRKNQDVEQFLRCFVADNQEMWSEYLSLAEFALNNHTSSSAGIGVAVPEEESFSGNLERVWTSVRHNLKQANRRSKKYFDKKRREARFVVGDMVWLSSRNLHLKIPSKKLGLKFVGPFKVVHIVNSAALRLDITSSWKTNSVFHVSLRKKDDTPYKVAMSSAAPIDEDCEFEISRILDSRWHRGELQYVVSWKGFGPEDNSCMKAVDVSASSLIKAFQRRFPNKARPRGSGGSSLKGRIICGLNAELHVSILQDKLLHTLKYYGYEKDDIVFQQDNDPKHTSRLEKKGFNENEVEVLDWPLQSPDLNPIEHFCRYSMNNGDCKTGDGKNRPKSFPLGVAETLEIFRRWGAPYSYFSVTLKKQH
ncbi:unnamed protein product [Ranitomeya imitator]|uniref:Chromo domain-containing protein n=1 Tax=Ranitomeya imitator TaxID=111125 RepID=A0ABN9MHZ9_9NEOB|nr:unnamed protein product [Ranitomeya imitator]